VEQKRIAQLKDLGEEIYLSLSDEIKMKMCSQQFAFNIDDDEIIDWIHENANEVYYIEQGDEDQHRSFVLYFSAEDAMAFKLRWG